MSRPDVEKARALLAGLNRPPEELARADLSGVEPDEVLDVLGEVCPYPANLTLQRLASMRPGQVLKVLTDHTIATHNVPTAVAHRGLGETLGIQEVEPGVYAIYVRRI